MLKMLNDPNFFYGAAVMGFLMAFLMIYAAYMRTQSLYLTAKHKGCEKINDKFYYIIEESEYNALAARNAGATTDAQPSQAAFSVDLSVLREAEALISKNTYPTPDKPNSAWATLQRLRAEIERIDLEG